MPKVNFNGRARASNHKRREVTRGARLGRGQSVAEVTHKNIEAKLSQHSYVDRAGIVRTLMCNYSPTKEAQRSHRYQNCRFVKGRCYLYLPGTSIDRTVTTTEPLMHGSEAIPRVEEKEGSNDEGAGRTGCRTTRGMGGPIRTSKVSGVGWVDACPFRKPSPLLMRW